MRVCCTGIRIVSKATTPTANRPNPKRRSLILSFMRGYFVSSYPLPDHRCRFERCKGTAGLQILRKWNDRIPFLGNGLNEHNKLSFPIIFCPRYGNMQLLWPMCFQLSKGGCAVNRNFIGNGRCYGWFGHRSPARPSQIEKGEKRSQIFGFDNLKNLRAFLRFQRQEFKC